MMIRPATGQDIPEIAKIYTESWKKTYRTLLPDAFLEGLTYEHAERKWMSYLRAEGQGIFLAAGGTGGVRGFSAYKPFPELERCLLLDSLHVRPAAQGNGTGKALIFAVGKYALEGGYRKMSICVMKGNDRAEGIYTHLGAKPRRDFTDDFEGTAVRSSLLLWDNLNAFAV